VEAGCFFGPDFLIRRISWRCVNWNATAMAYEHKWSVAVVAA
jgi:hypothetical protein